METLIIDGQHNRNQYCNRSVTLGSTQFGSPPLRKQKGFNCRSYHSGVGLLPNPVNDKSYSERSFKREIASPSIYPSSEEIKNDRKPVRSSAVPIPMAMKFDEFNFSERWAGPTYSNSPPPSSLPIPKFSMKPKRTVSLELPRSGSPIDMRPIAKSAASSPTRDRSPSPIYFLSDVESVMETCDQRHFKQDPVHQTDFATKALRRILNLDNYDQ